MARASRKLAGRSSVRIRYPPQGTEALRGPFFIQIFSTMYYIYVLFSQKTNRYYIGSTDDLQGRLKHHNAGSTPSTKTGAPVWEIRYTETVPDRAAALKREREIKKKKSRYYIERLIQKGN